MAIFIIDQFSLNTDLPLDIRYVPAAGRFDPDISVYKYPGMQVFDTISESIWYADNSLNWVEIGSGSDASINNLYNLVTDLSSYIYNSIDISIGELYTITNRLDISIGAIDISLNDYGQLLAIHEASIGDLYNQIDQIESSIGDINNYQGIQDASIIANESDISQIESSIGDINADIAQIESSIGDINNYQGIQDASIIANEGAISTVSGYQTIQDVSIIANEGAITIIDGSITYLTNITGIHDVSIGDLYNYNSIQDGSISAIEASLGDYVKKSGDTMTGSLIIDSSLQVNNTAAFLGNVDIGGNLTVDGSTTFVHTTVLDVSTAFIELNTGLTGTPPEWLQSGIVIERGDASSYALIYDETQQNFRIGVVNAPDASGVFEDLETQAVATREDNPTVDGVAVWNDTEKRFDTFGGFKFTTTGGLDLDSSLKLDAYAPGTTSMLVVQPNGYVSIQTIPNYDASIANLYTYIDNSLASRDSSIEQNIADIAQIESSIGDINNYQGIQDASIIANEGAITIIDGSITYLTNISSIHDVSIGDLYTQLEAQDTSVKGAINIGDGSAGVYAGITNDGSLQFREFVGVEPVIVSENGNLIEISIDASFGGEVNTASNIGTGEGVFAQKDGQDLEFKTISTNDPSSVIITSDTSTLYIDVSIDTMTDASLFGLTDTSINESELVDHTNIEWSESEGKWINTDNLWWDNSLGTTTDDLGGIPQGTDLEGKTLKEILYQILYEYQPPTLSITSDPTGGIYEKGLVATQFSTVDIDWTATNANYPLALLSNVSIVKTGQGTIYTNSLGGVASDTSTYVDTTGITNWGGTSRTINYNVYINDDQTGQPQPAVSRQSSFSFYYRQYWGVVDGNTNVGQVDSDMITGLVDSRLAGETDLNATFDNSLGGFVKYLFAYPDTVAAPDNFGLLSQIIDQNDFDISDSFDTENEDVSVGNNNVRYRFYLLKNRVTNTSFDITFKF